MSDMHSLLVAAPLGGRRIDGNFTRFQYRPYDIAGHLLGFEGDTGKTFEWLSSWGLFCRCGDVLATFALCLIGIHFGKAPGEGTGKVG